MRLLLPLMTNTSPQEEVIRKLFYTIIEVGVHILIGVSHILCKEMIDMLPEIIELIHQCAGEFSESGSSRTLAETWLLRMDVEPGLLKALLDGRLKLVLGLNINVFSFLFTSRVCIFLFSCKEMFMKPTSSWLVIGEIRRSCLDKRWCWNPNP